MLLKNCLYRKYSLIREPFLKTLKSIIRKLKNTF